MAITTIESKFNQEFIAWRFPKREISIGSQILVNQSEEALLFENGQLCHILEAGKHVIQSGNIPGLDGIIRRSIGNNSPLKIDIWFITKTSSTNYKWGTQIQVKDSNYEIIVPVGIYGSLMLRIDDPASFVFQVVGKKDVMIKNELKSFLIPAIERGIKDFISRKIHENSLDIFSIESILNEASNYTKNSLTKDFERFGIKLVDFYIQGIEVTGENPEYLKLKETLSETASLRIKAKAENLIKKEELEIENSFVKQTNYKPSLKEKLSELKELFDSGLISEKEYENKKEDFLKNI